MNGIEYETKQSTNPITIIKTKEDSSRNLLIQSVAFEFLNTSLLLPSQEIKRIQQEHATAKSQKIGSMALNKDSQMNPDTLRGLYVNAAVRAQATLVQESKDLKEKEDKEKKVETQKKNVKLKKKEKDAWVDLLNTHKNHASTYCGSS